MSHHYSGPEFGFPHGDARLDFTDLYVFPKPGDAGKSILIMNFHPALGANPPGPTSDDAFSPEAIYELKIDTNGDNVADIAYRVRFTSAKDGTQTATLRRVEGAAAPGTGDDGQVIVEGVPVSTGKETRVTEAGDHRFFAGWRSDPFFFDVGGALNNLQFTGDGWLRRRGRVQHRAGSAQLFLWYKKDRYMGSLGGRRKREMGSGGSRCASATNSLSCGRGERRLSRRGAEGRCPVCARLRACAGAHWWIYAGRGNASGGDAVAGRNAI